MVNDGTDGKYYAKSKGCSNIIFEPHGVLNYEEGNKIIEESIVDKLKRDQKFVLFNNASGSTWKRTDRIIRALSKVNKKYLENIRLLTTYYAIDKDELIEYTKDVGLEDVVIFLPKITPVECNYIIRKADVVIMANDFSNLGNPILESIYYQTPIISINDGSLDGFVKDGKDAFLIDLNKDFDKNMAKAIEKLYKNPELLKKFKNNLNRDNQVKELSVQQEIEFSAIIDQL
jgi:glycosyltransferase involved in cell wall biosynthesis